MNNMQKTPEQQIDEAVENFWLSHEKNIKKFYLDMKQVLYQILLA